MCINRWQLGLKYIISERAFEQKAIPAGCQNRRTDSAGSRYSLLPLTTDRPATDTANP